MVAGSQGMLLWKPNKNSEFTASTTILCRHLWRPWSCLPFSKTGMFSPVCRRVTKILVHTSGQLVERVLLAVSQGRRTWWGSTWDQGTIMQNPSILQTEAIINMPCTAMQLHRDMCAEMLAYFGKSWEPFFLLGQLLKCLSLYNIRAYFLSHT